MRILLLTPGTGSFYCGSCLRDNELCAGLRALGEDAVIAPLYLPFALEKGTSDPPDPTVRMGGINVYLQQKWSWMSRLPRFARDLFDSPRLLRWASARANMTDASGLGEMTLSMLRGEEGRQREELERLVAWMASGESPAVVVLSNVMLMGLARRIKETLGCPVLCTMQGEAPFLDELKGSYREAAWDVLRERSGDVDLFLPVSRYTGELMAERLGLATDRWVVVPNGIDCKDFIQAGAARQGVEPTAPPVIGYLARMCEQKGLPVLVEAFLKLHKEHPELQLLVGGVLLREDRALVRRLTAQIERAGAAHRVVFKPNLTREEKLELLSSITMLSVPATYGESFGLYLLEALAAGVPVVQPRHAAFPEILQQTGGGLLCEPDDAGALATALSSLLDDRARAEELGQVGRRAVLESFTRERMARDVLRICRMTATAAAAT